jgi:hypothetical protein
MAGLMGPGFGRILPMPLLMPYCAQVETGIVLVIPVIAAAVDWRETGRLHRAWVWGIGTLVVSRIAIELLAASPIAAALHAWITAGSPGAALPPFAIPMMTGA